MDSFSIGLSGLKVAKNALDIIGNNIANAATPGYHRQSVDISPEYLVNLGGYISGGGVNFDGITQDIDIFLEMEILRQQSSLGQISRELSALRTVETTFGELSGSSGLTGMIDEFFYSLKDLSAHPGEVIFQNQVLAAAEAMASQFRVIGNTINDLQSKISLEAQSTVEEINSLFLQIAQLNGKIQEIEITGGQAHNLSDQRNQLISELSGLIGVSANEVDNGVVNLIVAGLPVVTGTDSIVLEVDMISEDTMGLSISGAENYTTDVQGGVLGGLFSLHNEKLTQITNDLDSLASEIIQQVNQIHVQGVGSYGSFTDLIGWSMADEDLADFVPPISDGAFYIRVTDTSTGQITRNRIDVDVSTDDLTSIAAAISAVTGLSATVSSSQLRIQADNNYEFDFMPAVLDSPTDSNLTAGAPPAVTVSGIYTGSTNQTYAFEVLGTDSVGNGNLQIEVRNGASELVTTLNVGSGYVASDKLAIENGIEISLSTGDLNDGDTFEIDTFETTDTSGFVAAAGLNTFFKGNSASSMMVSEEISNSPDRIATSIGSNMTDNNNMLRMVDVYETASSNLDSLTFDEFCRRMITDIGQEITMNQMREDNGQVLLKDFKNQRDEISGVDINDEAARMMVFEQMFQAMAKYLEQIQRTIFTIMEII
ncbi:MAG: flagellar hook-associated protein FlgK [Planctomycetota bacterium]|jgi:flagellar hook-associated protein FlgK